MWTEKPPQREGCLKIRITEEYFIGRMAVLKEYRGRGYGSMVLAALEEKARELGASRIKLNAQKRAAGFYRTLR